MRMDHQRSRGLEGRVVDLLLSLPTMEQVVVVMVVVLVVVVVDGRPPPNPPHH